MTHRDDAEAGTEERMARLVSHGGRGAARWDRSSGRSWSSVPGAGGTSTPPLVDVAWLRGHHAEVVLLQVDDDAASYHERHLPGAVPISTWDDLHEQVRRGPVTQVHFEELMSRRGVSPADHVVLYSAADPSHAAFAFWVMRMYGHRRLSVLDGGLPAWRDAGGRLEDVLPGARPGTDYASPGRDPWAVLERDELLQRYVAQPPPVLLLDCRTPPEYEGSGHHQLDVVAERHRVPGHIPGSVNLPSSQVLAGYRFRPVPELRALFEASGLTPRSDVAVYCRVADRSALLWFALSELLGHPRVRHYVGGWAEYGSLIDVPVARD